MDEKETSLQEVKKSFTTLNTKFTEQSEDLRTLLAQTEALQKSKVIQRLHFLKYDNEQIEIPDIG